MNKKFGGAAAPIEVPISKHRQRIMRRSIPSPPALPKRLSAPRE